MTLYTDRKPREAVARALRASFEQTIAAMAEMPFEATGVTFPKDVVWEGYAAAALNTLRELGFITSEGLDAIHAEEDANGEPRSSVVPGANK